MQIFRTEALRGQDRLHGDVSLVPPVTWQVIGGFLLASVVVAVVFLSFAGYARTTDVSGRIEGNRGVLRAVSPRDGVVAQVLVREGDRVRAGQPLVRIDLTTRSGSDVLEERRAAAIDRQDAALSRRIPGLAQEARARVDSLEAQIAADRQGIVQLGAQIAEQRTLVATAVEDLARARRVAERGFVSQDDIRRREETLSLRRQTLSRLEQDRAERQARIVAARADTDRERASLDLQMADLDRARGEVAGAAAGDALQRTLTITAAAAGTVTGVTANPGDPVGPARPLLSIVPGGTRLIARLAVPPSAAGFVKPGQEVRIAVDAFPRQVYGTLTARISHITAATVPIERADGPAEAFLVDAALERDSVTAYGRAQPLRPGMTISARITTRRQSLLEWMLDPLYAVAGR